MELLLEKGEVLDLGKSLSGMRISCRQGLCWLTQAGDSRDHLLPCAEQFSPWTGKHLLLTALTICRVKLILPAGEPTRYPWLKRCYMS